LTFLVVFVKAYVCSTYQTVKFVHRERIDESVKYIKRALYRSKKKHISEVHFRSFNKNVLLRLQVEPLL